MEALSKESKAQLDILKSKLKAVAGDIKSILEQGRLIESNPTELFLFKGMFKELKSYFDSFNHTWDSIILLFSEAGIAGVFPSQNESNLQLTIKRYYYEANAIYEQHMNPTPVAVSASTDSSPRTGTLNDSQIVRARLPQINLPHFSGDQGQWPLFRDTYVALIHEEPSLSNIEKFHFLLSCLKGPALSLIKGVSLQSDNYNQAWNLLNENYNDKRRLAHNYLRSILDFSPFRTRPNAGSLKHLLSTVIESIESFKQLKLPHADDFILLYLVLRCLDPDTRKDFEKEVSNLESPMYQDLVDFLKREWKSLDIIREESTKSHTSQAKPSQGSPRNRPFNTSLLADGKYQTKGKGSYTQKTLCPVCKETHSLYHCQTFKSSSAEAKLASLQHWSGCTNCLSALHRVDQCKSTHRCQKCHQNHHTWLHQNVPQIDNSSGESSSAQGVVLSGTSKSDQIILGTALARILDANGRYQTIRLVADCGSQHSFITLDCVNRLGLSFTRCAPSIAGIGQIELPHAHGCLSCTLRPRYSKDEFRTDAVVVQDITGHLPQISLPKELHFHLSAFELADPTYWKPQAIDFLLGADLFFDMITGAPLEIQPHFPKLIPSKLGHIVAGKCLLPSQKTDSVTLFVKTSTGLQHTMSKFWEIEEVPKSVPLSEEEIACEQHFLSTYYRLPTGRFVVALPFKSSIENLQCHKHQVHRRFQNLEHRFAHNPTLKMEYQRFMDEYLQLGHMEPARNPGRYLLPHHCVTKIEDGKPKIRVVFDASCRGPSGSLNDHLLVGPKLQKDITDILLTFRAFRVAVVADIVKMYRQILVRPEDRTYQHILWRTNPSEELKEMELTTVTFGQAASSFLAIRPLIQLAKEGEHQYPLAAKALRENIHVDDIVSGASSLQEALQLQKELISLLKLGEFELSKWKSNYKDILYNVQNAGEDNNLHINPGEVTGHKILGLKWNSSSDTFKFEVESPSSPHTKRGILSAIARIYDPLGFLAPVVFGAKAILQDVWNAKCDWDEAVPPDIISRWSAFAESLTVISTLEIPRHVSADPDLVTYSIIGFSDASQRGYAAVLYLRVAFKDHYKIHLLKAKTKLAPIKAISIPRLELCGSLLLARLLDSCCEFIQKLKIKDIHLFTDSTVVLGWLNIPLNRLKIFVAHRVAEILDKTPHSSWNHVPSEFNPADCASRGLMPYELESHPLWWTGPSWLQHPPHMWPTSIHSFDESTLPEIKPPMTTSLLANEHDHILSWISRHSSYLKIIRSLCYVFRFLRIVKTKDKCQGHIKLGEMKDTNVFCIRLIQDNCLTISFLSSKRFKSLSPFKDARGLFRVGGRIQQANIPYDAKHPIILPDCHFTRLLIEHYHKSFLHIARIISTHPGNDVIVRVVTLRTSSGVYKRPVVKLVPLRLGDKDE